MAVEWTVEQKKVIDYRNRDILVSAAAGSGKTAVLVERIIQKITDPDNPVDIDRILVVTFTKAAASEMKERIGEAINKRKEDCPEDINLDRQMTLLHNAQITTIDSFCLFVVRNHFDVIDLEPNFRIADQGEIKLLEMDVLAEVFENNYAKKDNQAFLNLIDAYSGKRNDQNVREMISKLYHVSASDSWPKKWLKNLNELYVVETEEELCQSQIIRGIVDYSVAMIKEANERLIEIKSIAKDTIGLEKYVKTLEGDLGFFEELDQINDYGSLRSFFDKLSMGNIAAIRGFDGDENKKELVKNQRAVVKEDLKKLKEAYFTIPLKELMEQLHRMAPYTEELIRLSIEYMDAMEGAKRQKRIVDFSDIEHFALQILVDGDTGELRATATQFREQFEEIMIDEYQDSNQVQEDIMCAISREALGTPNMFMVGDVKQSIYRFRLARPELFMRKYQIYDTEDSKYQRIDLHKNFRSRQEVVDFSNDIFYKIMHPTLGKVAYDEDAALYCGAVYPDCKDMRAEVLLFDQREEELSSIIGEETSGKRLEARMVAKRILDLREKGQVTDKKTGELRPVRFSDIVILFRSLREWGSEFANVLGACGIPAYVESSTGYFQAYEVQTILNMLKILDNPYQDIPMAAVLSSPMVGLDNEELAELRAGNRSGSFAEVVMNVLWPVNDSETVEEREEKLPLENEKLLWFGEVYQKLREKVYDTPIHQLIQNILDMTGFADYVAAMPAGDRRSQNVEMLLEKAIAFEKTSYKGLFHFIRYIDQLQKYEVDFGEADVTGENEDVVRIMTIHKSKGLEFPIVFVSGMGKKINMRDTSETLVLHSDLGMGLYEMGANPRIRRQNLLRTEIAEQIRKDSLGEELRVLYVALTRAKEKLILTGVIKDKQKTMEKYTGNVIPKVPLSFSQRVKATTYLDWLIPAVLSYPDKYELDFVEGRTLILDEAKSQAEQVISKEELEELIDKADTSSFEIYEKAFGFEYPYQAEAGKKGKYSVSELKHDSMLQNYDRQQGEAELPEFLKEDRESYIPEFARRDDMDGAKAEINPGALRGTAVHRVMEGLDFAGLTAIDVTDGKVVKEYVGKQLQIMLETKYITEEMRELVYPPLIENFVMSQVGQRMAKAAAGGNLFREKPFVMEHEGVLVQGIIDVFWLEADEIVLLDYKTDKVQKAEELVIRYKRQMELYEKALHNVFTREEKEYRVKEKLLYSFRLQEVIQV